MTPKFLRDEAARFRGMAESSERESSRLRLLAMAAEYEAKAGLAVPPAEPEPTAPEPEVVDAVDAAEPAAEVPPPPRPVRKSIRTLKPTAATIRRSTS